MKQLEAVYASPFLPCTPSFPFFFSSSSLLALRVPFVNDEDRGRQGTDGAAGIFPVDIFLVGMRSRYVREALRSKRPGDVLTGSRESGVSLRGIRDRAENTVNFPELRSRTDPQIGIR